MNKHFILDMNKTLYILFFIICYSLNIQAQNDQKIEYIDVIYFKNGTNVRGTIVYQIPKVRVNIRQINPRTQIDSVYTYQMADIDKIVKERADGRNKPQQVVSDRQLQAESGVTNAQNKNIPASQQQSSFSELPKMPSLTDPMADMMTRKPITRPVQASVQKPVYNDVPTLIDGKKGIPDEPDIDDMYRRLSQKQMVWRRQITGIRVLSDYGYTQGIGKIGNNRLDWATSIGYQFNPIYYFGVGVGYNLTLNKKQSTIPVFINPRINFLDNDITPYLDFKVGYSINETKGIYLSPTVGVSFAMKGTKAISVGLGYSYMKGKYKKWSNEDKKKLRYQDTYSGIHLRFTYEFNIYTIK